MYRGREAGVAHARRDEKIDWMREYPKARQNSYQMSESAFFGRSLRLPAAIISGRALRDRPVIILFPWKPMKYKQGNDIVVKNICRRQSYSIGCGRRPPLTQLVSCA